MKSKTQKRTEAIERQKEYDKLSTHEKLNKLHIGGFKAKKQRSRLLTDWIKS